MRARAEIPDPRKLLQIARRAVDLVNAAGRIVDRVSGNGTDFRSAADGEQLRAVLASLGDVAGELADVTERLDAIEADELEDDELVGILTARVDAIAAQMERVIRNADRQELDIADQRQRLNRIGAVVMPPPRAAADGAPLADGES